MYWRYAIVLSFLFSSSAFADSFDSWSRLREIQLSQAMMDDTNTVVLAYQELIKNLPSEDPVRPQALFELGRVRYHQGDIKAARSRLKECVRKGISRSPCLELLSAIELKETAITELPTLWDFDADHGFMRPWSSPEGGSIRVASTADNQQLEWTSIVHSQERDRLITGVNLDNEKPTGVSFQANPTRIDGYLQIIATDVHGKNWYSEPRLFPVNQMLTVDVDFESFRSLEDHSAKLPTQLIDLITIEDITSMNSVDRGTNHWLLDDFRLY